MTRKLTVLSLTFSAILGLAGSALAAEETGKKVLSLEDFAGTWVGQTEFQNMRVVLLVSNDGKVTGGAMGTHPLRKRGEVTVTDAARADGFKITFYFSDVGG